MAKGRRRPRPSLSPAHSRLLPPTPLGVRPPRVRSSVPAASGAGGQQTGLQDTWIKVHNLCHPEVLGLEVSPVRHLRFILTPALGDEGRAGSRDGGTRGPGTGRGESGDGRRRRGLPRVLPPSRTLKKTAPSRPSTRSGQMPPATRPVVFSPSPLLLAEKKSTLLGCHSSPPATEPGPTGSHCQKLYKPTPVS